MALTDITGALDAAVAAESDYAFVLVQTNSTEQMVIVPSWEFEEKKAFYEENFDADGAHKTYPGIALLAADHGDESVNIKLRNDFYGSEPLEEEPDTED